jgi:rhodanese-related sulfurtransferase
MQWMTRPDPMPAVDAERPDDEVDRKPLREQLRRRHAAAERVDARPRLYVSRTQDIRQGATWRHPPERVHEWAAELSKSQPVVVFCVYGFHVGCRTAIALRDAGFDARYMAGGHAAWRAIGGKTLALG